jgi:prephenate dehydratase
LALVAKNDALLFGAFGLIMEPVVVAFQGEPGAYSELAALEFFTPAAVATRPCASFDEAFQAVSQAACSHGVLPIENSLAGSIHRNYDLMLQHDLFIVGECPLRVQHCLLALPGARIESLRYIHSHPQALAQCEKNLKRLGVELIPEADTAGSARLVREKGDLQAGALASRRAAQVNGLQILAENMEDDPANYTRFLVLSRQPIEVPDPEQGDYKTSVVFSLKNYPGVLFKALGVFALREIDLTKIESRPIPGRPWEYMFYVDFAGHQNQRNCQRALEHLQELATYLRILGSYPRRRLDYEITHEHNNR